VSATVGTASSAVHQSETLLFFTLLQLAVIVSAGRLGGALALRLSQSRAVGEIIVGILLGPSLFGAFAPALFQFVFRSSAPEPMTIMSQIGLILLMFQIGMEFDFSHLATPSNRKAVLRIAVAGLALPFALGLAFGYGAVPILAPAIEPFAAALFIATAFCITALPILGRIMMELDMTRTSLGVIAISAAAINDVVGWLLLAMVSALTLAHFSLIAFAVRIGLLAAFLGIAWWLVRPLLLRVVRSYNPAANGLSGNLLGLILALIFLSAMTTYKIGIFAIFGGFLMGVMLHDEPALVQAWKQRVGEFVVVFFLPIFFTYTGLRTNIGALDTVLLWFWCLLLIALATLGKFGGCYLASRLAGLNRHESKVIGVMMNTRALMELIVINIGYDLGVISQNLFTMLVLMAIFSTVITTPLLRRWLPRAGIRVPAYHRLL
jgi:Kef-type K+ transport system membrane component KefB